MTKKARDKEKTREKRSGVRQCSINVNKTEKASSPVGCANYYNTMWAEKIWNAILLGQKLTQMLKPRLIQYDSLTL